VLKTQRDHELLLETLGLKSLDELIGGRP